MGHGYKEKKQRYEPETKIGIGFLPNQSGDHSRGMVRDTPVEDFDIPNKKYVDDEIAASPHTPEGTAVLSTGETNTKYLRADGDDTCSWQAVAGGGGDVTAAANLDDGTIIVGDGGAKGIKDSSVLITELDTLTDDSIADTLHRHTELVSDATEYQKLKITQFGSAAFTGGGIPQVTIDVGGQGEAGFLINKSTGGSLMEVSEAYTGAAALLKLYAAGVKVALNANGNSYFNGGKLGIGLTSPNEALTLGVDGVLSIDERAAAPSATAAYGKLWVKTATPNQLWFTDDAGNSTQIV